MPPERHGRVVRYIGGHAAESSQRQFSIYGKRRRRDLNPRYRKAVHRFSRPALSTTQAPLRHLGESTTSLRKALRSWKNSLSTSPHSSARMPAVMGTRWLSRGSETRR